MAWSLNPLKSKNPAPLRTLILIIDDEPDLCRIIGTALEAEGFAVEEAHHGEDGLAMAIALRPAAIMLDLMMPRMNGYQFLARLQSDPDPALAATPVVMMTAMREANKTTPEEWIARLQISGYLPKPYDPAQAVVAVRAAIANPRPQPETSTEIPSET